MSRLKMTSRGLFVIVLLLGSPLRAGSGSQTRDGAPPNRLAMTALTALEETGNAEKSFDGGLNQSPNVSTPDGSASRSHGALLGPLAGPRFFRGLGPAKPGVAKAERASRGRWKDNSGLAFGVMAVGAGLGAWGGVTLAGMIAFGGAPGVLLAIVLGAIGFWAGASIANDCFPG